METVPAVQSFFRKKLILSLLMRKGSGKTPTDCAQGRQDHKIWGFGDIWGGVIFFDASLENNRKRVSEMGIAAKIGWEIRMGVGADQRRGLHGAVKARNAGMNVSGKKVFRSEACQVRSPARQRST